MGGGTFWALAEETAHQRPESVLLADGHGRVRSEPQRPQAVTRSSSSPGPGDESGTATTSYRPSAPTTAARTTPPTGSDAATAAGRGAARCQAAPTGAGAQLSPCAFIASMTGFQCSRVLSRI